MHELPDAFFAFVRAHFAVKVLVGHHVGRQLAPSGRDLAVALLEEHLAAFALDGGDTELPLDSVERIGGLLRTEHGRNCKSFGRGAIDF